MARILMVDDEKDLQVLIHQRFRTKIQEKQFEFIFAHNGFEALDAFKNQPPVDILVTDIHMPGMDGLTLLDKVSVCSPQTCAIVLSAYDDVQNLRRAMNHGAFDFMTKPLNFSEFEKILNTSLQKKKYTPSHRQGAFDFSNEQKEIISLFEKDFFQENLSTLPALDLGVPFLPKEKKNRIILDSFAAGEESVLAIFVLENNSLASKFLLIKIRDALRAISSAAPGAPEDWIKNLYIYQKKFALVDFSVVICCIDAAGSCLRAVCAPEEKFFLEEEGAPLKQPLKGPFSIFTKKTTIFYKSSTLEMIVPLVFFKKKEAIS